MFYLNERKRRELEDYYQAKAQKDQAASAAWGAIIGLGVGALAGLLFAPKPGSEKNLLKKARKL